MIFAQISNLNFLSVLSSIAVPVPESAKPITKSKDRCKFYPLCSNATCAFFHPTLPCKLFPNCKFGDSCAYVHPRCKFDTSCARVDCNFSHSQAVSGPSMPPIGEFFNFRCFQINFSTFLHLSQPHQSFPFRTTNPSASRLTRPSASSSPTAPTRTASFSTRRSASTAKAA